MGISQESSQLTTHNRTAHVILHFCESLYPSLSLLVLFHYPSVSVCLFLFSFYLFLFLFPHSRLISLSQKCSFPLFIISPLIFSFSLVFFFVGLSLSLTCLSILLLPLRFFRKFSVSRIFHRYLRPFLPPFIKVNGHMC